MDLLIRLSWTVFTHDVGKLVAVRIPDWELVTVYVEVIECMHLVRIHLHLIGFSVADLIGSVSIELHVRVHELRLHAFPDKHVPVGRCHWGVCVCHEHRVDVELLMGEILHADLVATADDAVVVVETSIVVPIRHGAIKVALGLCTVRGHCTRETSTDVEIR